METVEKVLVIALDGATWDLLAPWMAGGAMPALAQLAAAGRTGPLQSTLPPVTSPAWPSFMTGKQPANHGVFDFFQADTRPGQVALIDSTHIRSRLFWEYLSAAGLRVGVLNVPATYPPRPVNGYLVPGLLAPEQGMTTYPPHLLHPYASELGHYRLTPQMLYEPGKETGFAAELREVTATQIRYALRLARDFPTDFMMVHFLATDIAQHKLWHHLDPAHPWHDPARAHLGAIVRDLYTQIDAGLAQLLALMSEATVIVMSDHGFGPQTRTVNLNLYFAQRGLLTFKPGRGLRRLAWRHKWLTKIGQRWWGRERLLNWDDVEWSRTRAYSKGHMGQVWLNVPQEERAAARAQVATALRELRDPATGKRLVDQLIWREEVAHGPYGQLGPDLHLIMDGYRALAYPMLAGDGRVVTEQRLGDSGHHRPDGILVAAGPGIGPGGTIENGRLIDLAPTILHLFGIPIPDDLDGTVLRSLLADRAEIEYQPAQPYDGKLEPSTKDQQEKIVTRLQALGYLEGSE